MGPAAIRARFAELAGLKNAAQPNR